MLKYIFLFLLYIINYINSYKVDVFKSGEYGYYCFKIPYLLSLNTKIMDIKNSTINNENIILAFSEARKDTCGDFTETDLVMRRSIDGGKTWGDLIVLVESIKEKDYNIKYFNNKNLKISQFLDNNNNNTVYGNAAPVQIQNPNSPYQGRILLPFCRNNKNFFNMYSDDYGITWSKPKLFLSATKIHWLWYGIGPPAGLELKSGRIILPSYHTTLVRGDGEISKGHIVYSDDYGETWEIGETRFGDKYFSNECQAVQLNNGSILINSRSLGTYRLQTISNDEGITFGETRKVPELREPIEGCEGSIIKDENNEKYDILYFSNPANDRLFRENMSLFKSIDGGNTWELDQVIDEGPSGYSALTYDRYNTLSILYESRKTNQVIFMPQEITFKTLIEGNNINN